MFERPRQLGPGWGASGAPEGRDHAGWAKIKPTENLNVSATVSLVTPRQIKSELPMSPAANQTVVQTRQTITQILSASDRRLLAVVGPCSIHDEKAALEYAGRLAPLRRELADRIVLVMRVYFEKPRTSLGWKGLINDPYLDGSFAIEEGLRKARRLLLAVNAMDVPAATEMLDPIIPQYISDLVAWASIGARTTESQTHRQLASGLSMPVGYKNNTEGNLEPALDAMRSARAQHSFVGIDDEGHTVVVKTRGNPWGHLVLRGGRQRPNYDPQSIARALDLLARAGLPPALMVDCSHANSGKKFQNQHTVWESVIAQRVSGRHAAASPGLMGLLLESNLFEGSQPLRDDVGKLRYGVSITDECVGWEQTEALLRSAYAALA